MNTDKQDNAFQVFGQGPISNALCQWLPSPPTPPPSSAPENRMQTAANACAVCRSQKRKCDKRTPSCSRCIKKQIECNYYWDVGDRPLYLPTPPSDFPLSNTPAIGSYPSIPAGALQSLQPYQHDVHSPGLDIDRFIVRQVMNTLVEQRQSLEEVQEKYFTYIHTWLPVVHAQSFRSRVSQLGHNPQAETALILLSLSLLTGMENKEQGRDNSASRLHLYNYLFSFLQLARGPSLELVQAGLLLALYELGSGLSQAASVTIGSCARLGYLLGLNIDPPQSDTLSWVRADEQRRTWMGVYIIDRLIHQVTNTMAPHAVGEPASDFRLPARDQDWDNYTDCAPSRPLQPTFSTPVNIPLPYFSREIQAARILGQVQSLPKIPQPELLAGEMDRIDAFIMNFIHELFKQAPESWEALCGANGIALMTAIVLHRQRFIFYSQANLHPATPLDLKQSILALSTMINMVRDIGIKFSSLDPRHRLRWVPLPAVICAGEAARAAKWLSQVLKDGPHIDTKPLLWLLEYSAKWWGLAEEYLRALR